MSGTTPTTYLDALSFGTGVAETTSTLGLDPLDNRVPPDQYRTSHLQIARLKNLLLLISQYWKGGARLQIIPQSTNPFGATESGFYIDNAGVPYAVYNGARSRVLGGEQTVPAAATVTIDPTAGTTIRFALSATSINSAGIDIGTGVPGQVIRTAWIQDGSGSRTLTQAKFSSNWVFIGGAFTVTAAASKRDISTWEWDSVASKWYETARAVNL